MAVGKAGEAADRDRLSITLSATSWWPRTGSGPRPTTKKRLLRIWRDDEIAIGVDIGLGSGKATVWTCDLTHDYISINADYRS